MNENLYLFMNFKLVQNKECKTSKITAYKGSLFWEILILTAIVINKLC